MGHGRSTQRLIRVVVAAGLCLGSLLVASSVGAVGFGNHYFQDVWARTDQPVANVLAHRTWMWGPAPYSELLAEPYAETPGGERLVQYFDKSRMEINDPTGDRSSEWFVTNGLLAYELLTGELKTGDNSSTPFAPAQVNVAGDPDDESGPTYASFNALMGYGAIPAGWLITQTVDRSGYVADGGALGQLLAGYGVTAVDVGAPTQHHVASVFWAFMTSSGLVYEGGQLTTAKLAENPFYITGYPLTEAYWTIVRVNGESTRVLVQVFERRVLTYTPDNPDGWKVEAGNVGQHYYRWRYETLGLQPMPPELASTGEVNISYVQSATLGNQDAQYEYVRMFNVDVGPIDLADWRLADDQGSTFVFPLFALYPGEAIAVWVCNEGAGAGDYDLHWGICQEVWDNAGDTARLYDADGRLISSYSYP